MEMIKGYKAFAMDGTNIIGETCEENKIFCHHGSLAPKKGYHFAKNLEDTLRYAETVRDYLNNVIIAEVTALGTTIEYDDFYAGYFGLYVTDKLLVNHIMTRDEIIDYAKKLGQLKLGRFVSYFPLTNEEIAYFYAHGDYAVKNLIEYYQLGNRDVYKLQYQLNEYKN